MCLSFTNIRQRIDTIYKTVGKSVYDNQGNEVSYFKNPFNRDSAYCSERYYALMKEATQLCNETGDILTQKPPSPSVSNVMIGILMISHPRKMVMTTRNTYGKPSVGG